MRKSIDLEDGTLHLILAFVKGMTGEPRSQHERADSPRFLDHIRRSSDYVRRWPTIDT